jgi:hypothetical protein
MRARGQLLDDAVQGGEPRGDQVREVTGTEEPFRAREQVVVVLVRLVRPRQAGRF